MPNYQQKQNNISQKSKNKPESKSPTSPQDKQGNLPLRDKPYKALVLDVDGTTIPNVRNGMPSDRVTQSIKNASKIVHVFLATSRPLYAVAHIIDHLTLSGPSIVNGGSQIFDARTKKSLWEQQIHRDDALKACVLLRQMVDVPIYISDGKTDHEFTGEKLPKHILQIYLDNISPTLAIACRKKLSDIPTIAVQKVPSWSKGKNDLLVTHVSATKQHGIFEVAKMLHIETQDIIGVGDGYNDFPLLMACGLKVAMGNAVPELKEIADYIAPSVEDDGVADVIEKFVL